MTVRGESEPAVLPPPPGDARGDGGAAAPAGRRLPDGALRAPALVGANALHYVFSVVASRLLGPSGYGALAALLGLVLVGAVPGLALQSVAARHTALAGGEGPDLAGLTARLLRVVAATGVVLGLLTVAAAPLLAGFLRLGSPTPVFALAACLVVLPLLSGLHGMLQGRRRWRALAAVQLAGAATKLTLGTALVLAGRGVTGALTGAALAYALEAALALRLVRLAGAPPGPRAGRESPVRPDGSGTRRLGREALAAGAGIAALHLLTNGDVLLARNVLPGPASGEYAVGAVVAKVAFWAPQFLVVVTYPRLVVAAEPRHELARAAAAVLAIGTAVTAGAALLGPALLPLVFGPAYAGVAPLLWVFAVLGTVLALVQLVLYAGLAAGRPAVGGVLVVAGAAGAALVLTRAGTVEAVVGLALAAALAGLAGGWALVARRPPPGRGRVRRW